MTTLPCIDVAALLQGSVTGRTQIAQQWGRAFEDLGFVTIVGHGVPEVTSARAYSKLMEFFDLPLDMKLRSSVQSRVKARGYLPIGIESVARTRGADTPPDLCEALVFFGINFELPGNLAGVHSEVTGNIYPDMPQGLADAVRDYYMALHRLVRVLMRLSACALHMPEDFFDPYYDRFRGTLRCAHYPAQAVEPEPGQLRYGAHSDYGGLTLLRQDEAPGGLQVYTRGGEWIDVRPVANSYVINIGDLMARWTNDRWRSTLHRVVNPPHNVNGPARRLSLVLFSGPNDDALIETLPSCVDAAHPAKYRPVRARDYIQDKLNASMPEKLEAKLR
jgi:isopenicillin N synthase-like dioxygenase